jgi:hemerythrin-like domain-containing protein
MPEEKRAEEYFDAISYFQFLQNAMLDKVNEMEKICLDAEEKEFSAAIIEKLFDLNDSFHNEFVKYYTLEEDLLFPELENVLPSPTSTTSMRNEHSKILQLSQTISERLTGKNKTEMDKLVSTIYTFADLMQRHIHKKNDVVYHEASSFLSEAALNEIYKKIQKKIEAQN